MPPRSQRDPLTGLINRAALLERLDAELARSRVHNLPFAVVLFDVDRFKLVNFGFGDRQGDEVLRTVGGAVKARLRPRDIVGRWGGQQFLCILPDTPLRVAWEKAEQMRGAIESLAMAIDANIIHATASFGVACFPDDGTLVRQLLAANDAALYTAKESGRNRTILARDLRHQPYGVGSMLEAALRENRVVPAYQPIVDLSTGQRVAEEALARVVMSPHRTLLAEEFIDAARLLQLTYKIDRTVMLDTFTRCLAQIDAGGATPMRHFVNISGNLLRHPAVVEELLSVARQACSSGRDRIGPELPLVIEITERELLHDIQSARAMLKPFMDFGVHLALDDFGSGYSSFQYLAELPFTFLKIEGSLIQRITEKKVRTIVRGIQNTAADLGLITVAEFVENAETADIARDMGVNWAQGYHFGEPVISAD